MCSVSNHNNSNMYILYITIPLYIFIICFYLFELFYQFQSQNNIKYKQ